MKVKTVSYCKTFNIGSYQSEKIGVEIDVEENETPEQCLSAAKSMVATFFTQSNPQLNYQEQETTINNWLVKESEHHQQMQVASGLKEEKISPQQEIEDLLLEIEQATTETLHTYQLKASQNQRTLGAYKKRQKQLNIQ